MNHPFWFAITAACVIWYSTITIEIAIKGAFDIARMLRALSKPAPERDGK